MTQSDETMCAGHSSQVPLFGLFLEADVLLGLKVADTDESARQEIVYRASCYFISYFTRHLLCNVRIIKTPFTVHWSVSTLGVHRLSVWKSHSNNKGQIINWKNILLTICLCLLLLQLRFFYVFFSCLCVCVVSPDASLVCILLFSHNINWPEAILGGGRDEKGGIGFLIAARKKKTTQN